MEAVEYARAIKRRWKITAILIVLGLITAWLTFSAPKKGESSTTFSATTTLYSTGTSSISIGSSTATAGLQTLAAFVTVGEVPDRVAREIGFEGESSTLASRIEAEADDKTGLMSITATSPKAPEATLLANTFASELIGLMREDASRVRTQDAQAISEQMRSLEREIEDLENRIASGSGEEGVLSAQRDSKVDSYSVLSDQHQQLTSGNVESVGLEIVEEGRAKPTASSGLQAPRQLPARLVLAAILGLLLGVATILVLEHLDMRIKDKGEAEEQFELPVLAEIPVIPRRRREKLAVSETGERDPIGDAFRFLTAALSLSGATRVSAMRTHEGAEQEASDVGNRSESPPKTILVTSSSPGEGKTTIVANLAAAFSELGLKVIVFSCDFQRPKIHAFLGVENEGGLVEALHEGATPPILNGHLKATTLRNVQMIPSGDYPSNPGELLSSHLMQKALAEAQELADVVLIDTAPLLAAGEATLLFPEIDGVLIVSRAGSTTPDAASRTRDVLKRLDAPMLGVVLNAAEGTGVPYYYYPVRERRRGLARVTRG